MTTTHKTEAKLSAQLRKTARDLQRAEDFYNRFGYERVSGELQTLRAAYGAAYAERYPTSVLPAPEVC